MFVFLSRQFDRPPGSWSTLKFMPYSAVWETHFADVIETLTPSLKAKAGVLLSDIIYPHHTEHPGIAYCKRLQIAQWNRLAFVRFTLAPHFLPSTHGGKQRTPTWKPLFSSWKCKQYPGQLISLDILHYCITLWHVSHGGWACDMNDINCALVIVFVLLSKSFDVKERVPELQTLSPNVIWCSRVGYLSTKFILFVQWNQSPTLGSLIHFYVLTFMLCFSRLPKFGFLPDESRMKVYLETSYW